MGDNYLNLKALHIRAKNGNKKDMNDLVKYFEKSMKKRSYVNGKFSEDVFQEMSIKLLKCIRKFEYKIAN